MIVEFVDGIVKETFHGRSKMIAPFAITIFCLVFLMNFMDMIPVDLLPSIWHAAGPAMGFKDYLRVVPTADLSTTLGLSFSVLVLCLFYNIKIKGLGGWTHELVTAPFGTSKNPIWALLLGVVNFLMQMIEFVAKNAGSHMYHSHHNATDQVGRGLLGAFIVEPKDNPVQYDREYIWVSNDVLGGFTINGCGFPATVPILAAVGERVLVRFMNEGVMMHPFHSHGFVMNVVARDGRPLGSAAFECDTLGVNPGERWDAVITVDRPGVWAFHCHILPHVEGPTGMFGMVTTLIVVPKKEHVDAIVQALLA